VCFSLSFEPFQPFRRSKARGSALEAEKSGTAFLEASRSKLKKQPFQAKKPGF
jgi:hypothetical protein